MFVLSHEFIQEERGLIFPFLVGLFSVTTQVGVSTVMVANLLLLRTSIAVYGRTAIYKHCLEMFFWKRSVYPPAIRRWKQELTSKPFSKLRPRFQTRHTGVAQKNTPSTIYQIPCSQQKATVHKIEQMRNILFQVPDLAQPWGPLLTSIDSPNNLDLTHSERFTVNHTMFPWFGSALNR